MADYHDEDPEPSFVQQPIVDIDVLVDTYLREFFDEGYSTQLDDLELDVLETLLEILTNEVEGVIRSEIPGLTTEEINNLDVVLVDKSLLQRNSACSICMESFNLAEELTVLGCTHVFHKHCISRWLELKGSCPYCRACLR